MSERYSILQHNTNTYRVVECPLILTSHALTKDNQTGNIFIQCRFENVDSKPIKALYIDVLCADVTNQALQSVENFSYLDIDVGQYQSFGDKTPVYLPDKETRSISISPKKIVFSDGSTWSNESDTAYELLEANQKPIAEVGELTDQYRRELHSICAFSEKHSCLPARKDGFIICGCGKVVLDNAKSCPLCGVEFEKLFALNDADKLQAGLEQYKQEQAEREEQERQAAEEKRKHAEEMKQQTIKTAKKVGIIGGCVAVLVAVCLLAVQVIIPNVRYSMASNAITAGNYEDAISTFEDLEDFKDSQEKIKEAQYAWAESKLASGDEDGAIELFEQLGDYADSRDKLRTLSLPQIKEIVKQLESVSGQNGIILSGTVNEDSVRFELSGLNMKLEGIPRRLEDFSQEELVELLNDTSILIGAVDSWIELKDSCIAFEQNLVSKFIELGGNIELFEINTVAWSDEDIRMFEFRNNELTFDYWDSMEKYQSPNGNLGLWADILAFF